MHNLDLTLMPGIRSRSREGTWVAREQDSTLFLWGQGTHLQAL